jgi:hypothetical protein
MSAGAGQLRFLPWLRRGLGAHARVATGASRPQALVSLVVRRGGSPETVTKSVLLHGPGDVTGLAPGQVIASDPPPLSTDFEPNHLVTVCLDAPELPWLFSPDPTPPPGDPAGRVRPWLCLVVVRRAVASLKADAARPTATLRLEEAAGELPDLAESWAWAHAQIVGTDAAVSDAVAGPPQRTLSRLVCPRRLEPGTAYLACVVPTFAAGVQAGLGQPVTAGTEPAWPTPVAGPLELPAYHSFEFATGPEGDVETLARRLVPRSLGATVGVRALDVSRAGSGLPALEPGAPGASLGLEGALRAPAAQPTPWPDPPREDFQDALRAQLSGDAATVTPPLYGAIQAGVEALDGAPAWLVELNLDPRHRAAAALGAQVVRHHQEQLMASAWSQAGDMARANQLLRDAQLGRAVTGALRAKRLAHLPARTLLRLTEPVHARVAAPGPQVTRSLHGAVGESVFPGSAVTPASRRVLRPRGGLGRRLGAEAPVAGMVDGLAAGTLRVPIARRISGGVDFDAVGEPRLAHVTREVPAALGWRLVDDFRAALGAVAPRAAAPPDARPVVAVENGGPATAPALVSHAGEPGGPFLTQGAVRIDDDLPPDVAEVALPRRLRLGRINGRFRAAATALQQYMAKQPAAATRPAPAPPLQVEQLMGMLAASGGPLDADVTIRRAVEPQVADLDGGGVDRADPLAPRRAAIHFPQPMSEALRALSEQHLLPGAEGVPPDTVGLLEANPRFIEAYVVGLNHELARELAWRGLESDQRATAFDQFWDVRGRPSDAPGPATDVPPIAAWDPARGLGANATRVGADGMLVLLVRGALLRRHPTMSVYAVRAGADSELGAEELLPEFRGTLGSDMTYVGFGLSVAEATGADGGPGWFFVFQEQATEPRFGADDPAGTGRGRFGGAPARWTDLTWGQLVADETAFSALRHIPVAAPALNPALRGLTLEGATWGLNAAHMAQTLLQRPVRIALHARTLLAEPIPVPEPTA